ncbi:MAG: NAD(P)-binding domain-containing protein [Betaproteobacteria bacterium]
MAAVSRWLEQFGTCLAKHDAAGAAALFGADSYWRDLVALGWDIRTREGREAIGGMLSARLARVRPAGFKPAGEKADEAWFSFETAVGRGAGHVRLRDGRAWTLLTALRELKGFEEPAGKRRIAAHSEKRVHDPFVIIIGGGQGGIGLAARLKRLGVPAMVIEKNERAGDSWRKRYKSLCLHDPVWYGHMPYIPFPDHWPVFSPKDRIADWLEMYVKVMELDYRASSECVNARYDGERWHVVVVSAGGRHDIVSAPHLVLATGMSGFASVPQLPGADEFEGTICHSSGFGSGEHWKGRRCVVVGAGTSAHDICVDLESHGAQVTMVQRAPSIVVKSEALLKHAWGKLYSEEALDAGITTDIADLTVASVPFKVLPSTQRPIYETIREEDAELYAGLDRAGFLYDFGEDGSGIHSLYLRRGAGYYIDVGASQRIIDGRIRLRSGRGLKGFDRRSIILDDGAALPADLVVFATGYGSMNEWAAKLISREVADKVGPCWGLGSNTKNDPGPWVGELRNMWKPTAQPGLWFHGGNLMQSRHYSLYLGLQLKARFEGLLNSGSGA